MKKKESILKRADEIIHNRSEEKERKYGPFSEGMERAAKICSGMTGKDISAHDMFCAMVALKMSRQSYNHKEDNLLDAVAYLGAWQNYIDDCESSAVDPSGDPAEVRLVPPSPF